MVPAEAAVIVQVAVPPPESVVVPDVQLEIPAVPETVQVTGPVGVAPPATPVSVAVKVIDDPSVVGDPLVTTLVGVPLAIVTGSVAEVTAM